MDPFLISVSLLAAKRHDTGAMVMTKVKGNSYFMVIKKTSPRLDAPTMSIVLINKMNTLSRSDGTQYELDCLVTDLEHLNRYMINLENYFN